MNLTVSNAQTGCTMDNTGGWGFHARKVSIEPDGTFYTVTHRDGTDWEHHVYNVLKSSDGVNWAKVSEGIAGVEPAVLLQGGNVVTCPDGVLRIPGDWAHTIQPYVSAEYGPDGALWVSQNVVTPGTSTNVPAELRIACNGVTQRITQPERYAYVHLRPGNGDCVAVASRDIMWSEAGYPPSGTNNNYVWDRIGIWYVIDGANTFDVVKSIPYANPMHLAAYDVQRNGDVVRILYMENQGSVYRNGLLEWNIKTRSVVSDVELPVPYANQGRICGDYVIVLYQRDLWVHKIGAGFEKLDLGAQDANARTQFHYATIQGNKVLGAALQDARWEVYTLELGGSSPPPTPPPAPAPDKTITWSLEPTKLVASVGTTVIHKYALSKADQERLRKAGY